MNLLRHKPLLIGGSIILVLAAGAVFGLIHFQGLYSKAAGELKTANDQLDRLNRRKPFPSAENVTVVQQNRDLIRDFLHHLLSDFRVGQVPEDTMEPAQFAPLLEKVNREVISRAQAAGVKVPERLALGFGRYMRGSLPVASDIPRLVIQARSIAALCTVLFDARIAELVSVERIQFENETAPEGASLANLRSLPTGGQDAPATSLLSLALPAVQSNDLYSAERLAVSFLAREHAAWETLNGLVRCPLFAVVKHVEITSETSTKGLPPSHTALPGLPVGAPGVAAPGTAPRIIHPPREERVVSGREMVRVSLVVDVCRFAPEPQPMGQP